MIDIWKGIIENRPVKIETYNGEGNFYRVHTTQGEDDLGSVESDGTRHIIMTPTAKGSPITIEGTPEEIRRGLIDEGFSENAINKIIDRLTAKSKLQQFIKWITRKTQ